MQSLRRLTLRPLPATLAPIASARVGSGAHDIAAIDDRPNARRMVGSGIDTQHPPGRIGYRQRTPLTGTKGEST